MNSIPARIHGKMGERLFDGEVDMASVLFEMICVQNI